MNGHSETPIPGGFGAAGGPNDGWHMVLHALTKGYLRLAVGWGSAPTLRKRLDELQMSVQACPSTKILRFNPNNLLCCAPHCGFSLRLPPKITKVCS